MKRQFSSYRSVFALLLLSVMATGTFRCRRIEPPGDSDSRGQLVVWGLWQDSTMIDPVLGEYSRQANIDVTYKKIASVASYEKELLGAIAEGRGPDVFVIHHTWVEGKRGLLEPAPEEVINERTLREEFVSVVADDLLREGRVYALPTSVDTLALYYNEDLLSGAGVARPPATWQEFQRTAERITQVSRLGIIEQSAAALGTAANVNRASDIIQLLMIQSGLPVYSTAGGKNIQIANEVGERALTFYIDFSNKSKKVYTWDLQQDYSLDAFAEGETAMMFNYSYHIPTIKAKNPRLRFSTAPMPQIADSTPRTFASYWPFAVSASSASKQEAWNFVKFLTSKDMARLVNEAQEAPPARRDSIEQARSHPLLGVFADQALVASTWSRVDIVAADAIFNTMIDSVVTGASTIPDALRRAEDQLTDLEKEKEE